MNSVLQSAEQAVADMWTQLSSKTESDREAAHQAQVHYINHQCELMMRDHESSGKQDL